MTRKHFNRIAKELNMIGQGVRGEGEYHIWLSCVESMADLCASTNSAFDRRRFMEACGASSGTYLASAMRSNLRRSTQ